MNEINLRIEGDHEFGVFSMFLIEIERNEISIPIFLTSEQTNLGLEDPEESNIELESVGGHFYTIYTENNDLSPLEMVEKLKIILN
jgi:hypothetical protein